jgi:hypothetical protein
MLIAVCIAAVGILPVAAQGPATPITFGSNTAGEVSAANPNPAFSFTGNAGQTITVQALSLTPGFAPQFEVFNSANALIQSVANAGGETIVDSTIQLAQSDTYTIRVSSANGTPGQFVLSLQEGGTPLPPPTVLVVNEPVAGDVSAAAPIQRYRADASQVQMLTLSLQSQLPNSGPIVTIQDATTGEQVAMLNPRFTRLAIDIPALVASYIVNVEHSGSPASEPYTVLLSTGGQPAPQQVTPTAEPPQQQPPAPQNTQCMVINGGQSFVNVRSGPDLNWGIVAQMPPGAQAVVVARVADNSWWQINLNGIQGWVSSAVIQVSGDCGIIPVVPAPPTPVVPPTDTPTPTEGPTDTPTPTNTPGGGIPPGPGDIQALTIDLSITGTAGQPVVPVNVPVPVAVTITNSGTVQSNATTIRAMWNGNVVGSSNVPVIQPGASIVIPVVVLPSPVQGPREITFRVDPDNIVNETSNNNNEDTMVITWIQQ